jgi:hypothetical protein
MTNAGNIGRKDVLWHYAPTWVHINFEGHVACAMNGQHKTQFIGLLI